MSAQHTPGPWKVDLLAVQDAHGSHLCVVVGHSTKNIAEDQANCHLIAAAPDLLAAVRLAFRRLEYKAATCRNQSWKLADQEAFDACKAALTKAESVDA